MHENISPNSFFHSKLLKSWSSKKRWTWNPQIRCKLLYFLIWFFFLISPTKERRPTKRFLLLSLLPLLLLQVSYWLPLWVRHDARQFCYSIYLHKNQSHRVVSLFLIYRWESWGLVIWTNLSKDIQLVNIIYGLWYQLSEHRVHVFLLQNAFKHSVSEVKMV